MLPLGPTGYGDSPYQSFSAFAGNTLLISPEKLLEDGLVETDDLAAAPEFPTERVDFGGVYEWKNALLRRAAESFAAAAGNAELRLKFDEFSETNAWWLDDYALFRAIKSMQKERPWYEWPDPLKLREPGALAAAGAQVKPAADAEKFLQFIFYRQWAELKEYAAEAGIEFIGDVPIFVALDSADVWCNLDKFKLKPDGSPTVVAGVPPDYFSATGQLWGNPIYDWDAMREDDFGWWSARLEFTLRSVDIIRMDHFRGFSAAWEVPAADETAANGEWVDVPGAELFAAMKSALGELPLIAEDLGVITPDVEKLRDDLGLPGMRILQFAFGGDAKNHDLPHNYVQNTVAYTGTHDNDTTVGWWNSTAGTGSTRDDDAISREREYALRYLASGGKEIHWDMIRAVWASVANTAIAPVQDLLGLASEARMNLPASESGNWAWRLENDALTSDVIARLREMTEVYGRQSEI